MTLRQTHSAPPAAPLLVLVCALLLVPALVAAQAPAAESPVAIDLSSRVSRTEEFRTRPVLIKRPGSYYLSKDLNVDGPVAIDIQSGDVTLDLRGHSVLGQGGRLGTGIAIADVANVSVHGGKLRSLGVGVMVAGSTNVVVRGLQIDGIDSGGAPPDVEIGVLVVNSRGVVVRDNVITDTFLGIFVRGEGSAGNYITDNVITGGDNGELAICYNPAPGADGGGPSGDMISGNVISRFRRAFSFSADSVGNVLLGNTFAYFDLGIVEATPGSNVIEGNQEVQIQR